MLKIDDQQIKKYERHLKAFARRAYPFATKATLNQAAFTTQKVARGNIKRDMITRNKWTTQSVRVNQARGLNVRRQASEVGSIERYMEDQESGTAVNRSARSRKATPIPQPFASGEGSHPMRRLPRSPNRRKNLRITRRQGKGVNRKQRNIIVVKEAAKKGGGKHVWLDMGKRKGIYQVAGGKSNPKVRKVWDLSRKSVKTPKSPWLGPAVRTVIPIIPAFYKSSLIFQLKRHNLFVTARW